MFPAGSLDRVPKLYQLNCVASKRNASIVELAKRFLSFMIYRARLAVVKNPSNRVAFPAFEPKNW